MQIQNLVTITIVLKLLSKPNIKVREYIHKASFFVSLIYRFSFFLFCFFGFLVFGYSVTPTFQGIKVVEIKGRELSF